MFIPGPAQLSESSLGLKAPQQCSGFPHPDQSCPVCPHPKQRQCLHRMGIRATIQPDAPGTLMLPACERMRVSPHTLCKVTPSLASAKSLCRPTLLNKRGRKSQISSLGGRAGVCCGDAGKVEENLQQGEQSAK